MKNNTHDIVFCENTLRFIIEDLSIQGRIGAGCLSFLNRKINGHEIIKTCEYLYVTMLYAEIVRSSSHVPEPFRMTSPADYSDKLVKVHEERFAKERQSLESRCRIHFLHAWLFQVGAYSPDLEYRELIEAIDRSLDTNSENLPEQFANLLHRLKLLSSPQAIGPCRHYR